MKKIFLLLVGLGVTTLLSAQQFSISAKLTGFENGTTFYLQDPDIQENIDSAVLNNNTFLMSGKLDDTPKGLYLSTTVDGKYYWCYMFIGNENVQVKGSKENFPFYLQISGSKSQDILNKLNDKIRALNTKRSGITDNLGGLLTDESDSAEAALNLIGKQLNHIDSLTDSIRIAFIKSNLNSYAALKELNYLKNSFGKDSLQQMYDRLGNKYKESVFGERILNYLKVGDVLKKGDKYHDFEATDQFGKNHKLSESLSKYVLIDFTETYCGPCILSIDELKEISKDYADSLNIISFCADQSKDVWEKGLQRDQPNWVSLWDGKGTYGETILKYGVTGYPTFFLINPEGKIISTWSGYGKNGIKKRIEARIKKQMK